MDVRGVTAAMMLLSAGAQASPPTPPKELEAVQAYVKRWRCSGTNPAGEKGAANITFSRELDGFWVGLRLDTARTPNLPRYSGFGLFGFDAGRKQWLLEGWDNFGGTLHMTSDDGSAWTGVSNDAGGIPSTMRFSLDRATHHLTFTVTAGGRTALQYDCREVAHP